MKTIDAVATLRPRPSGPPLRGRAPLRDGITDRRLAGHNDTEQGTADSTLNPPSRGRRLGVGALLFAIPLSLHVRVLLGSITYDFSHSKWYSFRGTGQHDCKRETRNGRQGSEG